MEHSQLLLPTVPRSRAGCATHRAKPAECCTWSPRRRAAQHGQGARRPLQGLRRRRTVGRGRQGSKDDGTVRSPKCPPEGRDVARRRVLARCAPSEHRFADRAGHHRAQSQHSNKLAQASGRPLRPLGRQLAPTLMVGAPVACLAAVQNVAVYSTSPLHSDGTPQPLKWLPATADVAAVLSRSDGVELVLEAVTATPEGFAFELRAMMQHSAGRDSGAPVGGPADGRLRLGFELSDGTRLTARMLGE